MRNIAMYIFMYLMLCFMSPQVGSCDEIFNFDDVDSSYKSFKEIGDYVFVSGRWKFIEGNENYTKPPMVNTVNIVCNKQSMVCVESIAELNKSLLPRKALLSVDTRTYKIVSWDNGVIRSLNEYAAADWEIKISVKNESAERSFREIKSRNVQTADPNNYSYWKIE